MLCKNYLEFFFGLRSNQIIYYWQGTLYVVLGSGKRCLATKRSWEVIGQLWPAIVQAQQSEKPSILRVVDDIIAKVSKNLESPGIEIKVNMCYGIYRRKDLLVKLSMGVLLIVCFMFLNMKHCQHFLHYYLEIVPIPNWKNSIKIDQIWYLF